MNSHCKRRLDGVLLLDKPFGLSSNTALQKVRRLYRAHKAGHTGNLDPYATGLLPICFGEATKFSQRWLDADKGYRATICLGATSTTGDGEGMITQTYAALPTTAAIHAALLRFQGEITQIPPMYSALKYQGQALYTYARRGETVDRARRSVTIKHLEWIAQFDARTIEVDVVCSKGTYIRVLAEDIGHFLGCGAYLGGLRRTQTGTLGLDTALTIQQLDTLDDAQRDARLLPVDALVAGLEKMIVTPTEARHLLQGKALSLATRNVQRAEYRLYVSEKSEDNARFIGLGIIDQESRLQPSRMLATAVAELTSAA